MTTLAHGPSATETRQLRTLFVIGAAGGLTDGQLLERFGTLQGDPAELAFAALVDRHGPMVLRVARSALVDEHSARDAFQATFLILARKARSLWVRDSLGPWLHQVAYRVASELRVAEARRRAVEKDASRPEAHQPRESDRSDLVLAIHQEIERLPTPYRLAVVTCHLEGLTQHEAAARLGWPVGTLQSRLARGRRALRDRLQRRGLAPSIGLLAGKWPPVPHALTASTAKGAATLTIGQSTAGVIAPAVLALIESSTKGMLMTNWKLAAVALLMTGGLVGSGVALGLGRPVGATDDPPASQAIRPGSNRSVVLEEVEDADGKRSTRSVVVEDVDGDGKPDAIVAAPTPDDPERRVPHVEDPPEPSLDRLPAPRPWETVVRIRIRKPGNLRNPDDAWGTCSGVVVRSVKKETVILTSGHQFPPEITKGMRPTGPSSPAIRVDLFDGKLTGRSPAKVGLEQSEVVGELIDRDEANDLALVRIHPGRVVPASRVVTSDKPPAKGMSLYALGCSNGEDATAWDTAVIDPSVEMTNTKTKTSFRTIKCYFMPKSGRTGGGLYTLEGDVVGICLFADPAEQVGLYARPEAIRDLLDRNGLAEVHGQVVTQFAIPPSRTLRRDPLIKSGRVYREPAVEPDTLRTRAEQDRRLDELERKLDQVLKAMERSSPPADRKESLGP